MKLKTLKEINPENELDAGNILLNHRLRQEAIKWIKEARAFASIDYRRPSQWDFVSIQFQKFFNITEEDLK